MLIPCLLVTSVLGLLYYVLIAFTLLERNIFKWPKWARAVFALAIVATFSALVYHG